MDYNGQQMNDYNNYEEPRGTSGMAVASLVLGIVSIPAGCCYGLGVVLAIVAIVLGVMSKRDTGGKISGMAIGGIVCAVFGILFGILFWVFFVIGIALGGGFDAIYNSYY